MTTRGPSSVPRRALLSAALLAVGGTATTVLFEHSRHERHPAHKPPDGVYRKLVVGWAAAEHCPVYVAAAQKGFFDHYNLDIDIAPATNDGHDTLEALQHREFDYAVAPALTWLPYLHAGLAAHLVMGVQPGYFRLLVRRSSGITRLDQLMDRNVAMPDMNAADKLFFAIMMRRKGLDALTRINWVDLPFTEIADSARAQRIDAVVAHDPYAWLLLQTAPDLFVELASSNTGHYAERTSLVLGVADSALQADPDAATSLVLALNTAARWANTHRDDAATLIAGSMPELSPASARAMLHNAPAIHPVLGQSLRDQIAQYCDELQLVGLLPDAENTTLLAQSYTRNVLRE
ncbi:ABC transporter substrate-binding protein [Acetobacter sp. TBRC 12305]|uniref:ABC transporter substrate-binding protein n=1 Tax=Acetobacter garciniae TaxID=2817435 RepID=A0A939HLF0_9PROT|nr:ABC transporter substrate-binding protein [Acetobacter garciniae]MBO1326608.1 ABC transporter substrate-binding protein [Acetobacter garciniae]MBX0346308.1 ABC transporter substrate-binding protein [Acetobacter garciniae]